MWNSDLVLSPGPSGGTCIFNIFYKLHYRKGLEITKEFVWLLSISILYILKNKFIFSPSLSPPPFFSWRSEEAGVYMFDYFDRQMHIFQEIWNHEPNIAENEMNEIPPFQPHWSFLAVKANDWQHRSFYKWPFLIDLWLGSNSCHRRSCPLWAASVVFGFSPCLSEMTLEREVIVGSPERH